MKPKLRQVKHPDEIIARIAHLEYLNSQDLADRSRIRALMNGGEPAIVALFGSNKLGMEYLPVVNMVASGSKRFAQKLNTLPDLKIDMREDSDSERERRRVEKRARIVNSYDMRDRLNMQMPQVARWLPGYGAVAWIITQHTTRDGYHYPKAELRDAYQLMVGSYGPDQQPEDIAFRRNVPVERLVAQYPQVAAHIENRHKQAPGIVGQYQRSDWESRVADGVTVVEYYDESGMYLSVPEFGLVVDHIPNMLPSGPPFVVAKRFAFDRLVSHYTHSIGVMTMMAKLNVLALMATEDSVFRETNIIGRMISKQYQRGRFAVNEFEQGSRIEKPQGDLAFQTFQQIDRLERQLRIAAGYPLSDDSQSPLSFATGQGLEKLGQSANQEVNEYRIVLKDALERLDAVRLEWDETLYGDETKPLVASTGRGAVNETYRPSRDIDGNYTTRRVYGIMAGWDEPEKIVGGLQLLGAEVIDMETFRENLAGLGDNLSKIADRIVADKTEKSLLSILEQRAMQGDAEAVNALIDIHDKPKQLGRVLAKYFTPKEPQLSPEEEAFLQQQNAGGQPSPQGPLPSVSTILSRLSPTGGAEGGVQTVNTIRR